jgi:hypothetical protein
MLKENLMYISTGELTHWPSDRRKILDLLDFGIMKGIPAHSIQAVAGFHLSSDHSPVLLTMHTSGGWFPSTLRPLASTPDHAYKWWLASIYPQITRQYS